MQLDESTPVVIRFQIEDYTDALHFIDQADRDRYSSEEIEEMCQARFNNWKAIISAPRVEPTAEEKLQQLEALRQQQEILSTQIATLELQTQE